MQELKSEAIILSEYYYAEVPDIASLPAFSYVENELPPLTFTGIEVPFGFGASGGLFALEEEKLRESRFIYTTVFSEQDTDILFSTISHIHYKIWLNGTYVGASTAFDLFHFFLALKAGENRIVLEINPDYSQSTVTNDLNNRLISREAELANKDSFLRDTCLDLPHWVQFFHTPDCRTRDCACIVLPRCPEIAKNARIKVLDDFDRELISAEALIGRKIIFQVDELKRKSPETLRLRLVLELEFTNAPAAIRQQFVLVCDASEEKRQLSSRWEQARDKADSYTVNYVLNEFGKYLWTDTVPTPSEAFGLFRLKKIVFGVEKGAEPYYRTDKNAIVYYKSPLDGQFRKIRICRPGRMTTDTPGVLLCVNFTGMSTAMKLESVLDKHPDFIAVDVAVAGFSTGTPVSETLISEGLDELRKLYSIDEQRIFIYGYCSNGSAVLNFIQGHPDVAAGAVVVETAPNTEKISNIKHTSVTAYYWEDHYAEGLSELSKLPQNKVFHIEHTTHQYLQFYLYNNCSFSNLNHRLEAFPSVISFRTERMRHNKSFWLTVNHITRGQSAAQVDAALLDRETISVRTEGCDDFTLTLPPQAKHLKTVSVNRKRLTIPPDAENLRFVCDEKGYFYLEKNLVSPVSRKGTGLLDVYYGPLRIVHDGSPLAAEISAHFSHPETMTFSPKLQVQYPVYKQEDFPTEERTKNLILLNVSSVGGTAFSFPVQTDENGYQYGNEVFHGPYCVMQVAPNPFHSERSILQICSNDLELFKNYLFLRKVVLPSALSGLSPYWNSQVSILTIENGEMKSRNFME